jgi:hypothetical protein
MKNLLRLIRTIMLTRVAIQPQVCPPHYPRGSKISTDWWELVFRIPAKESEFCDALTRTSKMLTGSVLIGLRPKVPRNWVYRVCRMFDERLGSKVMFNV